MTVIALPWSRRLREEKARTAEARRALAAVKAREREIHRVTREATHLVNNNHFGERARRALGGRL